MEVLKQHCDMVHDHEMSCVLRNFVDRHDLEAQGWSFDRSLNYCHLLALKVVDF